MKSHFFALLFSFCSLISLVLSPESSINVTKNAFLPFDLTAFKIQLMKSTLICILNEKEPTTSPKLIQVAKKYETINEEFSFFKLQNYTDKQDDKILIRICLIKAHNKLIRGEKIKKEKKLSLEELKRKKLFNSYKMNNKRRLRNLELTLNKDILIKQGKTFLDTPINRELKGSLML